MATDDDFQVQLQMEEEERQKAQEGYTYTDPNDGTVYEWDMQRNAWFPKVDDDFLAAYQASYGVNTTTESEGNVAAEGQQSSSGSRGTQQESSKQAKQAQKRKSEPGWFEIDEDKNTNVYVSGLPEDITMQEFQELMTKCGIIMVEEETGAPKLKLYKDSEGNLKGDGLCSYLKRESVALAIQLLDDSDFRGSRIHVEPAKFAVKGEYDPSLKKKKKNNKKKKKNPQEKLLNWKPEKTFHQRKRNEQVVIIKHMFEPKEFEVDAMLINEIRDDLRAECSKFGEVSKVLIFDNHPEGVTSVKFRDADDADKCVAAMNGRWFAKRQLTAELWDGKTDYKVEETDQEREARLKQWEQFLESDNKGEETKESSTEKPPGETEKESKEDEKSADGEQKVEDVKP